MRFTIILLSIVAFSKCYAQQKHDQFSMEALYYQNIDKTLAPVRNTGLGLRVGYTLIKDDIGHINTFNVNGMAAHVKSQIEGTRRSIIGNFQLLFDHKKKLNSNFRLGYTFQALYKDGFYKNIDQSHLYWLNFIGGGLSTSYSIDLNTSSQLSLAFRLPLLGFITRNEEDRLYKLDDPSLKNIIKLNHRNYTFSTVTGFTNPSFEINYDYIFNSKYTLSIFARSEYTYFETSANVPYKEMQNGIGLRLKSSRSKR